MPDDRSQPPNYADTLVIPMTFVPRQRPRPPLPHPADAPATSAPAIVNATGRPVAPEHWWNELDPTYVLEQTGLFPLMSGTAKRVITRSEGGETTPERDAAATGQLRAVPAQLIMPAPVLPAGPPVLAPGVDDALTRRAARQLQEILRRPFAHPTVNEMSGEGADDRNLGLPPELRAYSARARAAAEARDKEVIERLDPSEWSVHHLIGVRAVRQHQALLEAAARAGWRMDEPANLMALPRTRNAQERLAAIGILRPLHDNGHPEWNEGLDERLVRIEEELGSDHAAPDSSEYASRAREMVERLQARLRAKALATDRIVQISIPNASG